MVPGTVISAVSRGFVQEIQFSLPSTVSLMARCVSTTLPSSSSATLSPVYRGPVRGISTVRVSPPLAVRVMVPLAPRPLRARIFSGLALPSPAWTVLP